MRNKAVLNTDQLKVFETLPESYLLLSPDMRILTASDAYLSAMNISREEIIDKNAGSILFKLDPRYSSSLHVSLQKVIATGQPHQHKIQDGESPKSTNPSPVLFSEIINTPVLTDQGAIHYIIHKVVLAKQEPADEVSDNSLPAERKLLSTVFMQAPVAIAVYRGPQYVIEWANNTFCELLGRTPEQTIHTPLFTLLPELAGQGYEELLNQAMSSGEPYYAKESPSAIERHGRLDVLYWDFMYSPFRDDQGNVIGITAVATEVTERVKVRQVIEESEKRFRTILNRIPQMTWTNRPDGWVDFYNEQWYNYTGRNYEQLEGWRWRPVVHADDLDDMLTHYRQALKTGIEFTHENRLLRYDGSYRWHLNRAVPIHNSEGEIILWIGTSTDIHEKKIAEEQLLQMAERQRALNNELQSANEEVKASYNELYKSNQQLTHINADLDSFIYAASHDLKAPITNIQGLIQMLTKGLSTEGSSSNNTQKILGMMEKSVARFMNTITDLTDITRLQKQSAPIVEFINLPEVIESVKMDLAPIIEESEAEIITEVKACEPIQFAPKNLRSVVYNLLSNALKYRDPQRKPVVKIQCEETDEYSVMTVKDNGLGMDLSQDTRLFSMFQRLHDHVEGTGIGLYIVKKVIENADGKITVDSKLGYGTTFTVFFKR